MEITIIDYGVGNIKSLQYAINRLGFEAVLSNDIEQIKSSDKVILPGVGAMKYAMEKLIENSFDKIIPTLKQPILGICLGMQIMCDASEEENINGLGIFDCKIRKFEGQNIKIPHMGWNKLFDLKSNLYKNLKPKNDVYFVHSYYADINTFTIAKATHGVEFSASLNKNNFYGCQFHPEKSGDYGSQILDNFIKL